MRAFIIVSIALLCFRCSLGQSVSGETTVRRINKEYTKWLSQWQNGQLKETDLHIDSTYKIQPTLSFQHSEKRFQSCSPSGNNCIDIYSGSYDFDANSNSVDFNGEPESLIILSAENTDTILLHYGYSMVFQDLFWNSKNQFVVLGYEIANRNTNTPTIWVFDLALRVYQVYHFKGAKNDVLTNYVLSKFSR
jgi:hypothetical protein